MAVVCLQAWCHGAGSVTQSFTSSAVTCGAEILLVLPLGCRCDPYLMGDLNLGWTADHVGPGGHGGKWLKLFWCVLSGC